MIRIHRTATADSVEEGLAMYESRERAKERGRRLSWIRYSLVLLLMLGLPMPRVLAQNAPQDSTEEKIVDLSADFGEGYLLEGEEVRRLVGNVNLRQGNTTLTAREAIQYVSREEYVFTDNVRIVDEGDTLWAEKVVYNSQTKVGEATTDVRLTDGEVWLTAPSGDYYVNEKRADFEGGVTMVDSTATLTSQRGSYWLDEKRAEFYEDVHLVEKASTLEADSVVYFRDTEVALANGNVLIEHLGGEAADAEPDSTQRILLFGAEAYNDNRQSFSRITGDPLLVRLDEDSTSASVDTLLIRAEVLESTRSDTLDRLVAINSVQIWRGDMAAVADSAISDRFTLGDAPDSTREEIRLFRNPSMWYEDLQVFGDTIYATGLSGSIDSLFVDGSAFVAQPDSATGRIRQLKGGHLVGIFEGDTLRTMTVQPNAEVIYFKKNSGDGTDGVQMSGDIVHFWFEDDELRQIRWPGQTEGTVYPEGLVPEPFQLEGYRWEPERRPEKSALLQRNGRTLPVVVLEPAYTSAVKE